MFNRVRKSPQKTQSTHRSSHVSNQPDLKITHTEAPTLGAQSDEGMLNLQRTVGNRRTQALLKQGTIQRMPTRTQVEMQAQAPKKDIGFKNIFTGKQVVLKGRSTKYKAILDALDQYHEAAAKAGIVLPNNRMSTVNLLSGKLDAIASASETYVREHEGEEDRFPVIINLHRQATKEKQVLALVLKSTRYYYRKWTDVVLELGQIAGDTVELDQDVKKNQIGENRHFHGTSSDFLNKFRGELLTGKELVKRGVNVETGEGDFYSRGGGGAKNFISTGAGLPGMGTVIAYAKSGTLVPDYNLALFTDNDLYQQMRQLKIIVTQWDEKLNQVAKDDIMGARKELSQFEGLLLRMMAEARIRRKLPRDHPRRLGKPFNESSYPLMFEMDSTGLNSTNPHPEKRTLETDMRYPRAIGGERAVHDQAIDFRVPGRLKRVYCPLDQLDTVRGKLTKILGHSEFKVIPIEMLDHMPEEVGETTHMTLSMMSSQYTQMRRMVLQSYSEGMGNKTPVNSDKLSEAGQEQQIIKAIANGATTVTEIQKNVFMMLKSQVEQRLNILMQKLKVNTIAEIPAKAKQAGLIPSKW